MKLLTRVAVPACCFLFGITFACVLMPVRGGMAFTGDFTLPPVKHPYDIVFLRECKIDESELQMKIGMPIDKILMTVVAPPRDRNTLSQLQPIEPSLINGGTMKVDCEKCYGVYSADGQSLIIIGEAYGHCIGYWKLPTSKK